MRITVYPKRYAHGFVMLCFVVVMQSFIMNSHEVFIHIHQGYFAGTGAIVRLPQCQWSKPDGYGKISPCITTTKHSKAKTVCIFLGIYCTIYTRQSTWKYLLPAIARWYCFHPVCLSVDYGLSDDLTEDLHIKILCRYRNGWKIVRGRKYKEFSGIFKIYVMYTIAPICLQIWH